MAPAEGTPRGARQEPGAVPADGRKPFTHAVHVPRVWLNEDVRETQRDCRGCHDYSREGGHDPQAVCTHCHFSNEINQYEFDLTASEPSFATGLEALRSTGSLFQHWKHEVLECRECHRVEGDEISAPILMPKTDQGLDFCKECHIGEKPRQNELKLMETWRDGSDVPADYLDRAKERLRRGLVESLNESDEMGPNQGDRRFVGRFQHGEHILEDAVGKSTDRSALRAAGASPQAAREGNCGVCHTPMFDTAAGFRPRPGDAIHTAFEQAAQSCGSCHIADEARTPLMFVVAGREDVSRTAATFSHVDHLGFDGAGAGAGKATAEGYAAIEEEGCLACHAYDPGSPEGYLLKGALADERSFRGCQECHSNSDWAPADHGEWWTHEDHGDWQACTDCHVFGADDFGATRVRSDVRRRRPGRFRVETQAHPHITVADGQAIEETCAECHRQPVEALPSRIQESAFDHATHLPAEPDATHCAACHGATVGAATTSADIGHRVRSKSGAVVDVATGRRGLTYDPSACSSCHFGSDPIPLGPGDDEALESREVAEFDHAAHMGRTLGGEREIGCTDCHVAGGGEASGADGPALVGTLPAARDCTLCHTHASDPGPTMAARTGAGVTHGEVAACVRCHTGGVPALDVEVPFTTSSVVDLADGGRQFHPDGEDCTACHIPREGIVTASVASTHSRVFAEKTFYTPEGATVARAAIHRGGTRKLPGEVSCFTCHWTATLADPPYTFTSGTGNPELTRSRQRFGNELSGFPGG